LFRFPSIWAPLGAKTRAADVVLPSANTSRSFALVTVTLGGESPLIAAAASTGWESFTPSKAMVIIATGDGGKTPAVAEKTAPETTSVQASICVAVPTAAS
jgi:hypothetical protein